MKKLLLISNAVLAIAVIVLFVLHFSSKKETPSVTVGFATDSVCTYKLPIAYINVDSLLSNYQFAIDANDKLLSKGESSRATLNKREKQLETEMMEFQRKVQNNAFLSQERAEGEYARIMNKKMELEELAQKMTQDLMIEQQKVNIQMGDTVDIFLKKYVADKNIQVIFSNTLKDNILYSIDEYDITAEVVAALNARYKKK